MKKVYEVLSILSFVLAFTSVFMTFFDFKMLGFSIIMLITGLVFMGFVKSLNNQERIISLLEKSQNEEEKENRTE